MSKQYSGEVIRQAIYTKLEYSCQDIKCEKNLELGYNYGWDIYIGATSISLLKYAQEQKIDSNTYNFKFNFGDNKTTSFEGKGAFFSLFETNEDEESECVKSNKSVSFIFALKIEDKYMITRWECGTTAFRNFYSCPIDKTFNITLLYDEAKQSGSLKFSPSGKQNFKVDNLLFCTFYLTEEDYLTAEDLVKKRNYESSDWQRLLDRSFEKYWKYELNGQEKKLDKIAEKSKYKEKFQEQLPKESFYSKFFGANITRSCVYCGIKENQLKYLCKQSKRSGRGNRLEYDRLEDGKYNIENVELACYWCNNAKTDEFSPHEFKEIARGISEVWKKRLAIKKNQYDLEDMGEISKWKIDFPEDSLFWEKNHNYSQDNFCKKSQDSEEDSDNN